MLSASLPTGWWRRQQELQSFASAWNLPREPNPRYGRSWPRSAAAERRPNGSVRTCARNWRPSESPESRLRQSRSSRRRQSPSPLPEGLRRAYSADRGGRGGSEGGLSERTALIAKVQARGPDRDDGAHTARPHASEGSERAVLLQGTGGGRDHLAYGLERNAKPK